MESRKEFVISIDLSNFFNDARKQARIFINKNMKKIEDIGNKIKDIFHLEHEDFYLTSSHEYLPFSEDIRIVGVGELIKVHQGKHPMERQIEQVKKRSKRKLNSLSEIQENVLCKKLAKIVDEGKRDNSGNLWKRAEDFQKNALCSNLDYYRDPDENVINTKKMSVEKDHVSKDYICKGNLASYTKNVPVPTITNKYLKQKKRNIVKINVIRNSTENEDENLQSKSENTKSLQLISDKKNSLDISQDCLEEINSKSSNEGSNSTNELRNEADTTNKEELTLYTITNNSNHHDANAATMNDKLKINSLVVLNNQNEINISLTEQCPITNKPIINNDNVNESEQYTLEKKGENDLICSDEDNNKSVTLEIQEKFEKSTKSPDAKTLLINSSKSNADISEVQESSLIPKTTKPFRQMKQISGIGSLLKQLKDDSTCASSVDTSCTTDNENTTKRKRVRTRKRKTKPTTPISNSTVIDYKPIEPLKTKACPLMHLKFEYEEDSSVQILDISNNEDTKMGEKNENEDFNHIKSEGQNFIMEKDIEKAPEMTDLLPKVGDLISFKILRMNNLYTPEISSYITGKVIDFQNQSVIFDIIAGLDQCLSPLGKLTLEQDQSISHRQTFNWNDLIKPHLLFP